MKRSKRIVYSNCQPYTYSIAKAQRKKQATEWCIKKKKNNFGVQCSGAGLASILCKISSVQSPSHVQLFATPWIAARQASLSITNTQNLLKLMFIESVMPSSHLILCRPLLLLPSIFPSIRVFSNESALQSGGQSMGVSASTSVLPMNIQG